MKTKYNLILIVSIMLAVASCKRDDLLYADRSNKTTSTEIDAKKLIAPEGFSFSTEKEINIKVRVLGKSYPDEKFVIKIYNAVPNAASLISTGITDVQTGGYATKVRIPALTEFIWIEKVGADGVGVYEKVKAAKAVNHTFNVADADGFLIRKSGSGLSCTNNCTNTYNNHSGSITIGSGVVACFTGTINSNIVVNDGGAVKICASGSISSLTINGSGRAYILEGATIAIANINTNASNSEFYNWSDNLTTSGSIAFYGFCENHGKIVVNSDFNVNNGGSFGNYGELQIASNFNVSGDFLNYSRITVSGSMNNNSTAAFNNYCYLNVAGNLNNNGQMFNGRLIKTGQTYTQNSNGKTSMDNVGLLSVKNLMVNGVISGTGTSRAVVKVTGNTTINGSGVFNGYVDLCDSNGIETNNGQIQAPAAITCGGYIPTCACDTEGFGVLQIADADGDGVPDNQDEYPNDALRAFNSYIPCFNVCYTLAFEDLWPGTGDYDYNDMVVRFSVHKVLNYCNKVVDLKFKIQPIAVGASYENAFAFQLDEIAPSTVASVSGQSFIRHNFTLNSNGTEAGQDKAVIVCFDSPEPFIHRTGGGMFNTQHTLTKGNSDTTLVVVTFSTPVDDGLLDVSKLNPFIVINHNRGVELHLPDYRPTSLANTSLFGTLQDRSNPTQGKYYRTANNMPWAFMIQDNFNYPIEKSSITTAFNFFDDWVVSGGAQYPNWYRNFPLYRNNGYIY